MFCDKLRFVHLSEGLDFIGDEAFKHRSSLRHTVIPSTVQMIGPYAFESSRNLERVQFCEELEEFVLEDSVRDWWSNGVVEESLVTYSA